MLGRKIKQSKNIALGGLLFRVLGEGSQKRGPEVRSQLCAEVEGKCLKCREEKMQSPRHR